MSSRVTKDPYSTSFHEVDSRISASFKAESDLKKKTDKLQKELENSLLLYNREKVELNDFLADLRAPLGPRIVRTRKHSLGRGGGVINTSRGSHKPRSLPERRLSEPPQPVDHFPTSVIYDPFAWVDDGNESDESHETIEHKAVEVIPKVSLPESLPVRKTRRHSVPIKKASVFQSTTSSRLPSIHLTKNEHPPASSVNPVALDLGEHCPHIAPETGGNPPSSNDKPADAEHGPPMLTLATVANLKMGSSDLRRRIQKWCDNINEELYPYTEHESLKKVDDSTESKTGQDDGKPLSEGLIPPKITITSVINSMDKAPNQRDHVTETPQDCGNYFQKKYSSQVSSPHGSSSFFQSNIPEKRLPSQLSLETIRKGKSASTEPTTPVSDQRSSSKALSLYRELDKLTKSPGRLSQVNATDLRVISKSMQSFHDCKVYRGRNSIPSKSTDSKAFDELARAQYRLVQRQRIRAKQHGTSYDFGERVDAQIKRRNSVRWSM